MFERAGFFDESMNRGEDDEFNYRLRAAGGRILLTPEIRCVYYARDSFEGLAKQYWGYGIAKVAVLKRHPRRLRPRHLVPSALVLALVGGTVLAPLDRRFALADGAGGRRVRRGDDAGDAAHGEDAAGMKEAPLLPLAFACIHLPAGAGMIAGLLSARARPTRSSWTLRRELVQRACSWPQHAEPLRPVSADCVDSMTSCRRPEAERVRDAYARRAELGLDARYDYWQPANLFIYQARERAVLALLREAGLLPLTGRRVLDVGCGDGAVLRDLLRYGASAADLSGVDLLPERVERARELTPGARIEVGDAQALPFEDGSQDLVLGFTLLSSVMDATARRKVAAEMVRVTKRGGVVLLYDFWTNPTNRDVRPAAPGRAARPVPGREVSFRGTTLAPPLLRALMRLPGGWFASSVLEVLPFLRTHYVAAVHI